MENKKKFIEWMCTQCGKKEHRPVNMGRPQPGSCPGKNRLANGKPRPHSWIRNRVY